MPILFLIFILLILILYACGLVCRTSASNSKSNRVKLGNNHHSISASSNKKLIKSKAALCRYKTFIIFSIILLSTSIGFIVYGSQTFHHSYHDLTQGIVNFSRQFDKMSNETEKIEFIIVNDLNSSLAKISVELSKHQNDSQSVKTAIKEINSIKTTVNETLFELGKLNQVFIERNAYNNVLKQIDYVENIRQEDLSLIDP